MPQRSRRSRKWPDRLTLRLSRNRQYVLLPRPGFIKRWCAVQRGKVLQQQAVDEDVASSDFAQQDPFRRKIQKTRIVPGDRSGTPEQEAQDVVPKRGKPSLEQSYQQSCT